MKLLLIFLLILVTVLAERSSSYSNKLKNYRPITGYGNNKKNPKWGSTKDTKIRRANYFDDGISIPYGGLPSRLPNPRKISSAIFGRDLPEFKRLFSLTTTNAVTFIGQFLDHDVALTNIPGGASCCDTMSNICTPHLNIEIPKGDPIFDPLSEGNKLMPFCRSFNVSGTGTSKENPLQFNNLDTSFVDLSNTYGSDEETAKALRVFKGGLLKTSKAKNGEILPALNFLEGECLVPGTGNEGRRNTFDNFVGGDPRISENSALTAIHTLLIREHNRIANSLPKRWSDEKLYQEARKWNIAQWQNIIYYEWLPTIFGAPFPAKYTGYKENVNPQNDLYFSTAFMRFGHDMIPTEIARIDRNGRIIQSGNVILRDIFFEPDTAKEYGVNVILRGLISAFQFSMDGIIVEDVRDHLFPFSPVSATDLLARNIQRAREFGLGSLNDAREQYGLQRHKSFEDITTEPSALKALKQVYKNVDQVDIFPGMLLEKKIYPSIFVGELLHAGLLDQFKRFRDGDRFYFEENGFFSEKQLRKIRATTLGDLIARNTDTMNTPKFCFMKDNRSTFEIFHNINPPQNYRTTNGF